MLALLGVLDYFFRPLANFSRVKISSVECFELFWMATAPEGDRTSLGSSFRRPFQAFENIAIRFFPDAVKSRVPRSHFLWCIVIDDLPEGKSQSGLGGGEVSSRHPCLTPNTCKTKYRSVPCSGTASSPTASYQYVSTRPVDVGM